MQLTRNRQFTLLLELPFCREALRKIFGFAMWPLGAAGRRGLLDSGELVGARGRGRAG
jgi:hypothetical protein